MWGHAAIDMLPMFKTKRRLHDKEMVRRYVDHAGKSRVCGGADLKSSQAYPAGCLYIEMTIEALEHEFHLTYCFDLGFWGKRATRTLSILLQSFYVFCGNFVFASCLELRSISHKNTIWGTLGMRLLFGIQHYPTKCFQTSSHPRFGKALSTCRTNVQKLHRRRARKFLRDARKSGNKANTKKHQNNLWIREAKLESVIEFLSH